MVVVFGDHLGHQIDYSIGLSCAGYWTGVPAAYRIAFCPGGGMFPHHPSVLAGEFYISAVS